MTEFRMPSLGADMEAGTLVEWLVKPGDKVKRGDVVAVVETQKGAIEIEIFNDGVRVRTRGAGRAAVFRWARCSRGLDGADRRRAAVTDSGGAADHLHRLRASVRRSLAYPRCQLLPLRLASRSQFRQPRGALPRNAASTSQQIERHRARRRDHRRRC